MNFSHRHQIKSTQYIGIYFEFLCCTETGTIATPYDTNSTQQSALNEFPVLSQTALFAALFYLLAVTDCRTSVERGVAEDIEVLGGSPHMHSAVHHKT